MKRPAIALLIAAVTACLVPAFLTGARAGQSSQKSFDPVLVETNISSRRVRPGSPVSVTFTFKNRGSGVAEGDYRVFTHFERPDASCSDIRFQADHSPTQPTTTWAPGERATDGPHLVEIPGDATEGTYHVHVGVFDPGGKGRMLDTYVGTIEVSSDAPESADAGPEAMSASAARARRRGLAGRLEDPVSLTEDRFRFALDPDTGAWELEDRQTGALWTSNPREPRLGFAELTGKEAIRTVEIDSFDDVVELDDGLKVATPLELDGKPTGLRLQLTVKTVQDRAQDGLRFRWNVEGSDASSWSVKSVTLMDHALGATETSGGYGVLPYRMGELAPAAEGLPMNRSMLTYNDTSMALYGAVKDQSAILVAWKHPEVRLQVHRTWQTHPRIPGRRMVSMSLTLQDGAREFTVRPLGEGDYTDIGQAYRPIARKHGWLETWSEKRAGTPSARRMFGAADFKPFVFTRTVPGSRFNESGEVSSQVHYTFEEAARIAEHLSGDLGIDRAMFVLAGWIHRGYDNQHPDILPAAPECGGNEGLKECARRVKDAGFLFGLHDNYQDMYKDAPSWDPDYINENRQGEIKQGGNWAGGQAYQVCAIKQVELAKRPQNLPRVDELFGPTCYFIDTTFAWPLVECHDPDHPMTRLNDMKWKSRLCEVAKKHFNLFGSEEGREWAVPHADYFEGLLSHKVSAGHSDRGWARTAGGIVVPLFEIIYGDCLNLYCHQGDRATPDKPAYVLSHLVCAENAIYRLGDHLYYRKETAGKLPLTVQVKEFEQVGPRKFRYSLAWRARDSIEGDYPKCFVHFTHEQGEDDRESIAFQDDHGLPADADAWSEGATGPRTVKVPEKYEGTINWLIGLVGKSGRARLSGMPMEGSRRYRLGTLTVKGDSVKFEPAGGGDTSGDVFARADHGWAQGKDMVATDRMVKNTYEVLSWVNRLTANSHMTDHRFLTDDRRVEYSQFDDVHIWVNYGPEPYRVQTPERFRRISDEVTVLPQYGFLVLSPEFVAVHAREFGGISYEDSALFTARSTDRSPLWQSDRIRIYHGFGRARQSLCGREFSVQGEGMVSGR